ncbi:hypothetical protein L3Q82_014957 [Scortum barcoo]|uniref:Uncharacterized protein n=1 Tax=Scortum barcoo TaxID=214431 RepID=A0ACB8VSF7_9TELE|nr:hypothetical protein L3Q82_014957 [Scortum barcoo]
MWRMWLMDEVKVTQVNCIDSTPAPLSLLHDGGSTNSSPEFSQAKFDMSSFIGGIILVLCLQAGGFFAMRFLKSKEQSSYDPIFTLLHANDLDLVTANHRMEEEQADSSLDLSYLTEEEQSAILQVLQRDLELRRLDEGRVRILEETETDPVRLRSLSGIWFSEERSKRHNNCALGCALVHATIRHRKTKSRDVPLTELFNGEKEETSHNSNPSPEAETRLKDSKEEESGGSEGNLKPTPTPRTKCTIAQEDFDGHNGDTDSLSSSLTASASLKTSSSTGSLHSGYALSGSMMSLFSSGDFGVVEVRGRIQFSLVYDTQREELQVRVYRCEDIAPARKSRSDPYVKAYLLPDKSSHSKKKTSVKKKTLNPVYDQTLRYKVRIGELRSRTLNLSVWHAEPLGRNVFLGEVEVSLGLWDWALTQPLWQDLQPRVHLSPDSLSSRGTIVLSIKFIPEGFEGGGLPLTGELHIWLREAQGLLSNKGGAIDSFVRSFILPDASRQSGQKTRMVKRSFNPTYNHTMVYDGFHTSDLREACAELTVWQREGLKTHSLGGIRLSCGTGEHIVAFVCITALDKECVALKIKRHHLQETETRLIAGFLKEDDVSRVVGSDSSDEVLIVVNCFSYGQSYGEAVSWMDSTEEEVAVWTSIIENPNRWIDMTLPIRTNLAHRFE